MICAKIPPQEILGSREAGFQRFLLYIRNVTDQLKEGRKYWTPKVWANAKGEALQEVSIFDPGATIWTILAVAH